MEYSELAIKDKTELLSFFKKADNLFPIPLSSKQELEVLTEKLLLLGKVVAACCENGLAGVICGYVNDTETKNAYVSVLCVLPEFQGKSIAKSLLERFISESAKAGMKKVFLYTHSTNQKAIRLYENFGFHSTLSDREGDIKLTYEMQEESL